MPEARELNFKIEKKNKRAKLKVKRIKYKVIVLCQNKQKH